MGHYLPQIGLAYAAVVLGMLSPGPNILSVVSTSMGVGRPAGIAQALGLAAGSLLWGTLTAAGLTALIAAYAGVMATIKVAGGFYLLWLAFKSFRSAARKSPPLHLQKSAAATKQETPLGFFLRGMAIQATNPKAALTWIAIMSLGLGADAPAWVALAIVSGATVISAAGHILYAVAFSTERVVAVYARARRGIEAGLGVFFGLVGIKLLTSRA